MYDPIENDLVSRLRPHAQLELEDLVRQNMVNRLQSKIISDEPLLAQSKVGQLQEAAFHAAEAKRLVMREDQLLLAIDRMDSGVFGTCMDCGEDIEVERLEYDVCMQLCSRCSGLRIY
jgi:DnaK suppressor protein